MITIAEVIEQCAQVCEGYDTCHPKYIAEAIRALAAQYEGCIVADSDPDCWICTNTGEPHWSDGKDRFPLYRARETQR